MSFEYTGTDLLELMQKAVNYNAFLASLILKQQIPTSGKILDIGAGIGLFADIVRKNGYNVYCLEPDLFQANLLKEQQFTVSTNINELPDDSFDFIYALNVLEHIENDGEELLLWAKKLKKGGKLLIYVPAFHLLYSSMDKKVGHFRRYRKKDLTEKIIHAGLVPVCNAKYADSLGFFVTLLYKLINKNDGNVNKSSLIFYDRVLFPLSRLGDFLFNRLFGKNVFIIAEKSANH
ncbi:bifunctional 3-demethylubiquinone-9 3-methyltransferase/ 2-octaprenyl-6-hydroxy phenol methylase [Bacteroidales bacterium Barb7]|nr:bifunctional 3-demethylubiquinone-9 3-methyltransferase/ 2-octaprenyl-6-hydroxy phenol methylase [Bacteroidales bacterium Barb7]